MGDVAGHEERPVLHDVDRQRPAAGQAHALTQALGTIAGHLVGRHPRTGTSPASGTDSAARGADDNSSLSAFHSNTRSCEARHSKTFSRTLSSGPSR